MANVSFNRAKGATVELFRDDPAKGIVLLLEAVESDAALKDHDNLSDLLLAAGNTEHTAEVTPVKPVLPALWSWMT